MIECVKFNPMNKGFLVGFADLRVPAWKVTIRGFTVWEKEGRRWINAPGSKYTDEVGQEKHKAFFIFDEPKIWKTFSEEALKAIDLHLQN